MEYAIRILVSLAPVIVFLSFLVVLDSYKLLKLRTVLGAITIGVLAALFAAMINGWVMQKFDIQFLSYTKYGAPWIEEMLKGVFIVYLITSKRIGFMVDAAIAGIAVGAIVSLYLGAINFVSAFLLWWYSNYLKRLPFLGNLLIGFLSGLAIMLVAFLYPEGTRQIAIYSFFAGFFKLIREVIKDMEDLSGDHRFGYRTLPVVWGIRKTKQFLFLMTIVFATKFILENHTLIDSMCE